MSQPRSPIVMLVAVIIMLGLPACAPKHRPEPPPAAESPGSPESPSSPPRQDPVPTPRLLEDEPATEAILEAIESAEQLVKAIEGRKLDNAQREQLVSIQSFLSQAREALTVDEASRAQGLANKGLLLARQLEESTRN